MEFTADDLLRITFYIDFKLEFNGSEPTLCFGRVHGQSCLVPRTADTLYFVLGMKYCEHDVLCGNLEYLYKNIIHKLMLKTKMQIIH